MPNIETLKKQSKQYLRWHRDRYYPVAAIIRNTLPRFRDLQDVEILGSSFKLADAQELVARQQGFMHWQALLQGAETMISTTKKPQFSPTLSSIEAQIFVSDVQASCDFYTHKLGFKVNFAYGNPPFYGQVYRDHARLNLRLVTEPVFAGDIRSREGLLSATITVATPAEIKQLFLDYQGAEVPFHQSLRKEPWGAKTFVITDLDGNLILFAGPSD